MAPGITFTTKLGERPISLAGAFELVEHLRALETNIGGANMAALAIREHAQAGEAAAPIKLSPGQSAAVVSAVLHWSRESGDVPEDVDLLGQALVAQLKD